MHAFNRFIECMKQITIRKVGEPCLKAARMHSKERGIPLNKVWVEALERGLGVSEEKPRNGLEMMAGDSDFGPEWDEYLAGLRQVNPEDWK